MAIVRTAIATPSANTPGLNSSLVVTLASTTVGDLNIVALSCHSTPGFAGVQPVIVTPSGWTLIGDSWKTGTPSHEIASFYRFYQSGDPSTVTVAWGSGTNQLGNAVGGSVAYSGVDSTTPIVVGESSFTTSAGATVNTTAALTLGGTRWVISVFGNRSGATWSTSTDAIQFQNTLTASADMSYADSGAATSSGTARSATSSASTSVNNVGIFALNPAAATGNAAVAETDTITAAGSVGVNTGAARASVDTVTSTGIVGVVAGSSVAEADAITAAGAVGTLTGAAVAETDSITAAGRVGMATAIALATADTITAVGTIGATTGAAVASSIATVAAGQIGQATGAGLTWAVTITATGHVAGAPRDIELDTTPLLEPWTTSATTDRWNVTPLPSRWTSTPLEKP